MSREIGVGVIGCGHWGVNHVRVLDGLPGCRLLAIADQNEDRLNTMFIKHRDLAKYGDCEDLIRRKDIDAVVVATPATSHEPIVRLALESGKNVLCEKPLCVDTEEAGRLHKLAEERNRILMVGHIFLFNPGIIKLKELIDNGELGHIRYLAAVRTNLGPIRSDVNAAFDLAAHDVSIFNWLLNAEPEWVSASGGSFLQKNIEDVVFITLKYPSGVLANIRASWLDPKKVREITCVGSTAMATWNDLELNHPISIFDKGADTDPEVSSYGEFLRISMWEGDIRQPKISFDEPLKVQNRAFLEAISNGRRDVPSDGEFGAGVVRALNCIDHSLAQNGSPVIVNSVASS